MGNLDNLLIIAILAVGFAIFFRSRGWSTALPLLGVGIIIGLVPFGPTAPAAPEAIAALVLAPLVFGEALNSSYIDIKKVKKPVFVLAVGLVAATTLAVGGVMVLVVATIPAAMAFALGAILAPTDAVAVANTARRANLPRRVVSILEGESLVNDGTGMTALRVALVAAVMGTVTVVEAGQILAQSVIIGIGVGAIAGFILILVLRHSNDVTGFGGLLLIAPFPIYFFTEELEGSAILAIVVAALMASHAGHSDPSYRGRLAVATVWHQITFILQSIAFLLLGIELPAALRQLEGDDLRLVPIAVVAVVLTLIATRFLVIIPLSRLSKGTANDPKDIRRGAFLISWAGARGPVSALAAFSIPLVATDGSAIPYRDFVIAVSLSVIAVTLALAPTLEWFAKRLPIDVDDPHSREQWLRTAMSKAALDALENAQTDAERDGEPLSGDVVRTLRHQVERQADPAADSTAAVAKLNQMTELGLAMAQAEQRELIRLRSEAGVPDAVIRPLIEEVDQRVANLRASELNPDND